MISPFLFNIIDTNMLATHYINEYNRSKQIHRRLYPYLLLRKKHFKIGDKYQSKLLQSKIYSSHDSRYL